MSDDSEPATLEQALVAALFLALTAPGDDEKARARRVPRGLGGR